MKKLLLLLTFGIFIFTGCAKEEEEKETEAAETSIVFYTDLSGANFFIDNNVKTITIHCNNELVGTKETDIYFDGFPGCYESGNFLTYFTKDFTENKNVKINFTLTYNDGTTFSPEAVYKWVLYGDCNGYIY